MDIKRVRCDLRYDIFVVGVFRQLLTSLTEASNPSYDYDKILPILWHLRLNVQVSFLRRSLTSLGRGTTEATILRT